MDTFKKSVGPKNKVVNKIILKFSCFSQSLKPQMAYKQAESSIKVQEEYTLKICPRKLKKGPDLGIGFHLGQLVCLKKESISVGGCFGEEGEGSGKSIQTILWVEKNYL